MKIFLFLFFILSLSQSSSNDQKDSDDLDKYIQEYKQQDEQKQYVPSDKFDLQAFLDEMDQFTCIEKNQGQFASSFNQLCEKNLQKHSLEDIGNFGENGKNFWKYINEDIYLPLAFEMNKKNSLSEILLDLVLLNDNHSYVSQNDLEPSFELFEKSVLEKFDDLELSSQNPEDQKQILDKMTNILRMFHLHWNALRINDQVGKAKVETQNLMKKILQQYQVKEKYSFDIVKAVSQKITLAFKKFMKAHVDYQVLKKNVPQFIAKEIKIRYQIVANNIKFNNFNEIQYVQQLSDIVVLVKTFHLGAYQIGYSQQKCLNAYQVLIEEKIREAFKQFDEKFEEKDELAQVRLKRFTATLILKMVYINFRIFQSEGILSILNKPTPDLDIRGRNIIMLFNEFKDQMMLIPKKCITRLLLKNCTYFNINKILKYLQGKYKLKRSTGGWSVYRYILGSIKYMLSSANDIVWGNFTLYKNYYYQNLYSEIFNFKEKFMIKTDEDMNALSDLIFLTVRDFQYNNTDLEHTNHGLIDFLDMSFYNLFLKLKADFMNFYPLKDNMQVMTQLEDAILRFFVLFQKNHKKEVNGNFLNLLNILKEKINQWKIETSKKPSYTVQMSELPLTAVNLQPQVFHIVGSEPQQHQISQKQINQGFLLPPQEFIKPQPIDIKGVQTDAPATVLDQKQTQIKEYIEKEIKENPDKVIDDLFNKIVEQDKKNKEQQPKIEQEIYSDGAKQDVDQIQYKEDGNYRKHFKNINQINFQYFKKPNSKVIPKLTEGFDNNFQGGF